MSESRNAQVAAVANAATALHNLTRRMMRVERCLITFFTLQNAELRGKYPPEHLAAIERQFGADLMQMQAELVQEMKVQALRRQMQADGQTTEG
jgi:hypothetical protein